MPTKATLTTPDPPPVAPPTEPADVYRYPVADLMAASQDAFGVRPEVVKAALYAADLTTATRDEARAAIDAFLTREV